MSVTFLQPAVTPQRQQFMFDCVSWDFYDRTLRELDGLHYRISFDEGRLEIMTLGDLHEMKKSIAARVMECYALERDIPITGMGSVTCRREDLQKGLEPDECYYVNRALPPITGGELNLNQYLAPDLAIEVDVTSSSLPRLPIYAALNVTEIWLFKGEKLTSLHRQADGHYEPSESSIAFPELPMEVFHRFVKLAMETSQHAALKAFRDWMRENLPAK